MLTRIENDALGRPKRIVRPEGEELAYSYGAFGGLREAVVNGATTRFQRDAYGRVRRQEDPDRGESEYHYDGFGQLAWSESPEGHRVVHAYDGYGRPAGMTLEIDGESFTAGVSYDPEGRLETITYPSGPGAAPLAVRREYDDHGHLMALQDVATQHVYWQATAADISGRITGELFGNGAVTERLILGGKERVRRIHTTLPGGAQVQDLWYEYDDRLNVVTRTDAVQVQAEHFRYDLLDRMTCAQLGPPTWQCYEPIEYAPNGNLLEKPGFGTYDYDPDHPHAVASAGGAMFTYDAVGNQISRPGATVEYTAFDLPKTFTLDDGGHVTFDYDADERRVRKTSLEAVTVYLEDLYERTTRFGTGEVEHRYYLQNDERVFGMVTRRGGAPEEVRYVHVDALGSVDVLTDGAGAIVERRSYDAFGMRRDPSWGAPQSGGFASQTRLGFTGHEADEELGLVNTKGRLYDPLVGRFLQPDPIIAPVDFGQAWNPYTYALGNPLAYVDPTGWTAEDVGGGAVEGDDGALYFPPDVITANPPTGPPGTPGPQPPPTRVIEGATEAVQLDVIEVPVDTGTWGNVGGQILQPPATRADLPSVGGMIGDFGIGSAEGIGDIAVEAAKFVVATNATGGLYGAYQGWKALYSGYREGGAVGALRAVNPLRPIAEAGRKFVRAAEEANFRAAGHAWMTGATVTAGMAVGAARGVGAAAAARAGGAGGAGGALGSAGRAISRTARALLARPQVHRHHIFPQRHREKFDKIGIDIDQYTVELTEGQHLKGVHGRGDALTPGEWSKRWDKFFDERSHRHIPPQEVYQFGGKLMDEYGLSGRPIVPYR